MDLISYALAKKANNNSTPNIDNLIPSIGSNGTWIIKGVDTGIRATPIENVEVDGILKANTSDRNIVVIKNGIETIVGEYTSAISIDDISDLFDV